MTGKDAEQMLLRAVIEHPEDDRPRLAYAGLLRKRGDPLGDFIVAQCELARRSGGLAPLFSLFSAWLSPKQSRLRKQNDEMIDWQRRLWQAHGDEWSRPLKIAGTEAVLFYRGFPYELKLDAQSFPLKIGPLLKLAPTVRTVRIRRPDYLDQPDEFPPPPCPTNLARSIAQAAPLAQLDALRLEGIGGWGDAAIQEIVTSPHLTKLRLLDLSNTDIGPDGIEATLHSPHLLNLEALILGSNPLSLAHLKPIARLTALPQQLRMLDLSDSELGDDGAACLAGAPALSSLYLLRLGGCHITAEGLKTLLDSPYLNNTIIDIPTHRLETSLRHTLETQLRRHNEQCAASHSSR